MTDNGTKFVNTDCDKTFGELGIIHQRTCPYTPQQNGVMESKHRHVNVVTKSLLFQLGMSKKF